MHYKLLSKRLFNSFFYRGSIMKKLLIVLTLFSYSIPVLSMKRVKSPEYASTKARKLIEAIRAGDPVNFEFYLTNIDNINCRDAHGNTPLHYACSKNPNAKFIKGLLEAGADINIANIHRLYPLTYLARKKIRNRIK